MYPAARPPSETQHKILASLEGSRYHTVSPTEASTSSAWTPGRSVRPAALGWNRGKNHPVLRLHPASCSGTFLRGQAMVAEASPAVDASRPGFSVALPPLPEAHPVRGGAPRRLRQHSPHPGEVMLALAEEGGGGRMAGADSPACPWSGHCEWDRGPEP